MQASQTTVLNVARTTSLNGADVGRKVIVRRQQEALFPGWVERFIQVTKLVREQSHDYQAANSRPIG